MHKATRNILRDLLPLSDLVGLEEIDGIHYLGTSGYYDLSIQYAQTLFYYRAPESLQE